MKETLKPAGGDLSIPFFSPVLHCISMTAIVFLRSSFGFRYLGSKAVFFAFAWAFALFAVYAWIEPGVWREYRSVCVFGIAAIVLYTAHLFVAFSRALRQVGRHDRDVGYSHALRLMKYPTGRDTERLHLWIEPALVFCAAAAFRFLFNERHLSAWLMFVGVCFWCKEALSYWMGIRVLKAQQDMLEDAGDMGDINPGASAPEPPKATRREPVKKKRNFNAVESQKPENHFAKVLELREPFTLEMAEENYRRLTMREHPDIRGDSPESNATTAELNEAIEYFRSGLKG